MDSIVLLSSSQYALPLFHSSPYSPCILHAVAKPIASSSSSLTITAIQDADDNNGSLISHPHPSIVPLTSVSSDSLYYESGYLGGISDKILPLNHDHEEGGGGEGDGVANAMSNLTSILCSRVYDVAIESPLQLATKLSERLGVNFWIKREDLQPVINFYHTLFLSFIFMFSSSSF